MKAKVILWVWAVGWLMLFAGIGTIEQAEFGSLTGLMGWLLTLPWFVSSLLIIQNERECLKEADKLDAWIDNLFRRINKIFNRADS